VKRLRYLAARNRGIPADAAIEGMEQALARQGVVGVFNDADPTRLIGRILNKAGLIRTITPLTQTAYITPLMQMAAFRAFPQCLISETIAYCFDCWPSAYERWAEFFRATQMKVAFISARQSAEWMANAIPGLDAIWMPEAIELAGYATPIPFEQRAIDVLELGRRWDSYHDRIAAHCAQRGYVHRYERTKGELVFADDAAFRDGLVNTRISICFPSSLTHPDRSGDVETLTLRYLESIASQSVIVGNCPQELKDLFGYDPVIQYDKIDPCGQIDTILHAMHEYRALVNRNYARLLEVGTWDARVKTIIAALIDRGYAV
jgi:hypothetical protein